MINKFTEFLSITADLTEANQGNSDALTFDSHVTQQQQLSLSTQQINSLVERQPPVLNQDPSLSNYISNLQTEHPTNPPFTGPLPIINIMSPELTEPTAETLGYEKQTWMVNKLWLATSKTKEITQLNRTNNEVLDQIASQAMTQVQLPPNATDAHKDEIIYFNKEIIKLFLNSAADLELNLAGSSHAAILQKITDLGLNVKANSILIRSIGELLLSPAAYSLKNHFNSQTWETLATIPVSRAQGALSYLTMDFLVIQLTYSNLLSSQLGTLTLSNYESCLDGVLRRNAQVLGSNTESFFNRNTATNNRVSYKHIGGGVFVVLFTSGLIFYFKMPGSSRLIAADGSRSTSGDVGQAVVKVFTKVGKIIKNALTSNIK